MPFTPAHAVAALPLRNTRLDTASLVIGCMSPDFEYFLRLSPTGSFGHTFAGAVVLDLPLSILVLWLYQNYVRDALQQIAPRLFPFQNKPVAAWTHDSQRVGIIAVSVLAGVFTHIVWDSFTHPSFWPYEHIAMLHTKLQTVIGHIEVYKLLQYLSTLIGMLILAFLWWRWVTHKKRPEKKRLISSAGAILIGAAAICSVSRVTIPMLLGYPMRVSVLATQSVVTFLTCLWLGLVLLGIVQKRREGSIS